MEQKIIYVIGIVILISITLRLIYKYFIKPKEGFAAGDTTAIAEITDVEALRNVASLYNKKDLIINNGYFTGGNAVVGPSNSADDGQRLRMHSAGSGGYIDVDPATLNIRGYNGPTPTRVNAIIHGTATVGGDLTINGNVVSNDIKSKSISTNNTDVNATGYQGYQLNGAYPLILNSQTGDGRIGFGLSNKDGWVFARFPKGGGSADDYQKTVLTYDDITRLKALAPHIDTDSNANEVIFKKDIISRGANIGIRHGNNWGFRNHFNGSQAYLDYQNKMDVRRNGTGDKVIFSGRTVCYHGNGSPC